MGFRGHFRRRTAPFCSTYAVMNVVIELLKKILGCVYNLVDGVCTRWAPNVGVEGKGIDAIALGELDLGVIFTLQTFRGYDHLVGACPT
jgi:hypothetical protein